MPMPEDNNATPEQVDEWFRIQQDVGDALRYHFESVARQPLPAEMVSMLERLKDTAKANEGGG